MAAIIVGTINLQFTSGPLDGQNYIGSFSYDDGPLSGIGLEEGLPNLGVDPPAIDVDLTLSITVDGLSLTEMDDEDYPAAPVLLLNNGVPTGLDFLTDTGGTRNLRLFADGSATLVEKGVLRTSLEPLLALTVTPGATGRPETGPPSEADSKSMRETDPSVAAAASKLEAAASASGLGSAEFAPTS